MGWVGWLAHDIRKEETEAEEDEQAAEAGAEEGGEVEEIEARSKKQTIIIRTRYVADCPWEIAMYLSPDGAPPAGACGIFDSPALSLGAAPASPTSLPSTTGMKAMPGS